MRLQPREDAQLPLADGEAGRQPSQKVSVSDLADILRDMAAVLGNQRVGNPSIGTALVKLSRTLRRYAHVELEVVLDGLKLTASHPPVRKTGKTSLLQGTDIGSLELSRVRELLASEQITRQDLIQLGVKRFGIPESRLARQNKVAVLSSVETALRNSETLDIISEEAKREGSRRSWQAIPD